MKFEPDQNIIAAIQAFQNGNLEHAENLLNKVLLTKPVDFDVLLMLGVINGITGRLSKALECLVRAAKLQPKNNFAHFNLAKVYSDIGNETASLNHHKMATSLAPDHVEAWLNYGRSLFRLRQFHEARDCFHKAIKLQPDYAEAIASLASVHIALGEDDMGLPLFDKAISLNPSIPGAWLMKADGLHELKNYEAAIACYEQALKLKPDYAEAWSNKGITLHELKNYEAAIACYEQALKLKPDYAEAWSNKGISLHGLKNYEAAIACYEQALKLKPDYAEAWSNKGITLHGLKNYEAAIACYEQALKLKPDYAEAWSNKGISLHELKNYEAAIACYEQALKLKPDYAEAWSNKGISLHGLKNYEAAIACYEQALKLKPDYAEAWSNKGSSEISLKKPAIAINSLTKAIALMPLYSKAHSNLGLAHIINKDPRSSIICLNAALSIDPLLPEAWATKGLALNEMKDFPEGLNCYSRAYELDSNLKFILGGIINNKLIIGDWSNIPKFKTSLLDKIITGNEACAPHQILSLTDDEKTHLINAQKWASEILKARVSQKNDRRSSGKIRLGYYSPDFKSHPVSILLARVIELHDRDQFEVHGFSCESSQKNDSYRTRMANAFDHFYDVDNLTDEELCALSHEKNIDIAIDLAGYTKDSRSDAFSLNLAPIQVNYLGFAGTMGSNLHDYIIGDRVATPLENQRYYTEKIVHLPNCFLPDDDTRQASPHNFQRSDFGLPSDAFIFCCFNSSYKFNPEQFELMASILHGTENSILWLSKTNDFFSKNIADAFNKRGINPSRIIFAERLDNLTDHLARLSFGDLFLDTFPYNAHASAVDALRSGLPLLTRIGESMASRVSASLLESLKLPELIAHSSEEYVAKAIYLWNRQSDLKNIKSKLMQNVKIGPTFDTKIYTQHLENAYKRMIKIKSDNLPAENISIG